MERRSKDRQEVITRWIEDLASDHGVTRKHAREALVELGEPAVESLKRAMQSSVWEMRWGATKALGQLDVRDASVINAFVERLDDERSGVRWLAADALISRGRDGLVAVLRALIQRAESLRFRESAHHVVHDLAESDARWYDALMPVAAALNQADAAVTVPGAARAALQTLPPAMG